MGILFFVCVSIGEEQDGDPGSAHNDPAPRAAAECMPRAEPSLLMLFITITSLRIQMPVQLCDAMHACYFSRSRQKQTKKKFVDELVYWIIMMTQTMKMKQACSVRQRSGEHKTRCNIYEINLTNKINVKNLIRLRRKTEIWRTHEKKRCRPWGYRHK
jgi:hypothetical protein